MAYIINDFLVGTYNQNASTLSAVGLISVTALTTVGSLVFIGFQFYWFKGCAYTIVLICITIAFIIASFLLVIFKTRKDSSILTSSLVTAYVTYLGWSAMASIPN